MIVSLNAGSRSRSSWFCLVLPCVIGLKKLVSLCQPLSNPMMTCSALLYSYLGACSSYFFNCSDWSIVLFTSVVIGHRRSGFQLNVESNFTFALVLLCYAWWYVYTTNQFNVKPKPVLAGTRFPVFGLALKKKKLFQKGISE